MLIRSQDKSTVINFDHIVMLKNIDGRIIYTDSTGNTGILGIYLSPDRAKNVLTRIVEFYAKDLKYYRIPEE